MKKTKAILFFIFVFSLWIFLVSTLWPQPLVLTTLILTVSITYFLLFKKKNDLLFFVVAAIAGPVGEGLVSSSGLWKYSGQTIFGIPYWLPLAWGITAIIIKRLIDSLTD